MRTCESKSGYIPTKITPYKKMKAENNVLATDHSDLCYNDISFQNLIALAYIFKSNMRYFIPVKWFLLNFCFVLFYSPKHIYLVTMCRTEILHLIFPFTISKLH